MYTVQASQDSAYDQVDSSTQDNDAAIQSHVYAEVEICSHEETVQNLEYIQFELQTRWYSCSNTKHFQLQVL